MIGLKAVNCDTGDVLAEAQEQAAGKEAVLKALDAAAIRLRGKLGESLSAVEKYATPWRSDHAIAGGAESLQPGGKGLAARRDAAALPFYKRAVDLIPNCHGLRPDGEPYVNLTRDERLTRTHARLTNCG